MIYLIFTVLGFILQIIILTFLKQYITDYETAAIIFITINFIFFILDIHKYKYKIRNIIFSAYVIRLAAMFWDVYARHIFVLPNSGADSAMYFRFALRIYNNIELLFSNLRGGLYSKTLAILFNLTFPHRIMGQYLNVLLGVSVIIIIYKILVLLEINEKTIFSLLFVIALFPNAVIFSAILLREVLPAFFSLLSFYYFVKWFKKPFGHYILLSFITLLAASAYHSGMVGLGVGYVFMYMFYKHDKNKFVFSRDTVMIFIFFLLTSTIIYNYYIDVFLGKFAQVDEIQDVYATANSRLGGSAYLTWLSMDSWWQMLLFSPLKMLYFIASPLPTEWRGARDIITFLIDGIFYGYFFIYSVYYFRKLKMDNKLIKGAFIALLVSLFIFGIGVSNAGTAMRHRHKLLPIFIIIYAAIREEKLKNYIYEAGIK